MAPAAGGSAPAPAQSVAAAFVVTPAIAAQDPVLAPARRDPPGQADGTDPANAAARKTAWGVPGPALVMAAANPSGGIIGGDASWPALAVSKRGKSASSDSLKSFSDGSGPSAQEDSIVASVLPHPVAEVKPISTGSNPRVAHPLNASAAASSQQNSTTTQPNPGRQSGSNSRNNGGSRSNGNSGSHRAANSSGDGASSGSGGDDNRNCGSLGSGSSCNSINGDVGNNPNDNVPGSGTNKNNNDSSRNLRENINWNNNVRSGGGSRSSNGNGNGNGNNRNSGASSNHWNNNFHDSNGTSNGGRGRGGFRGRRDHERGGNFSPRNYPRGSVMLYQQQQQPGVYQPGPSHIPPLRPATHFMVPQNFVPYVPPFSYHGDVQSYPLYPPVEQFQNMHLLRAPMQPSWAPQHLSNLQQDIRTQIEFYFSTNNLCHDTYLRRHMNDQGWVPIDLILNFNRMMAFTSLVDTNYILDAIRGSESLEVQGNNVRRRNDWAAWLLN